MLTAPRFCCSRSLVQANFFLSSKDLSLVRHVTCAWQTSAELSRRRTLWQRCENLVRLRSKNVYQGKSSQASLPFSLLNIRTRTLRRSSRELCRSIRAGELNAATRSCYCVNPDALFSHCLFFSSDERSDQAEQGTRTISRDGRTTVDCPAGSDFDFISLPRPTEETGCFRCRGRPGRGRGGGLAGNRNCFHLITSKTRIFMYPFNKKP